VIRGAAIALLSLALVACGGADRSIGTAQATCERFRTRLVGAHSTLLSGLATSAGTAASDLRAAGVSPLPWSRLPPDAAVSNCTFTTLPIRPRQLPTYLFVDASGRTGPVPVADEIPADVNGP